MNAPASPFSSSPLAAGRTWVAAFAVLTLLLLAAGWWFYRSEANSIRAHRHEELAAIGELKAGQIQLWRRERMNDATRMAGGPLVRKAVTEFLREPGGPLRADLQERLRIERTAGGYADVLIFAPGGQLLLAANDAPEPSAPATRQLLAAALASRGAVLSDFFRHADGVIHIEAAAAVRDATGQPLAVTVLRSDAAAHLYPMIQSWPTPSRSGETFIVQREGDSIIWLNEARHQTNTALTLRQPLARTEIPAVQAALGRKGIFEGVDYRGAKVLADLRPIAGTPWFLVAKVDAVEIFAEARTRAGWIAFLIGALTFSVAAALTAIHRQQNAAEIFRLNAYNRSLIEASLDPLVTISAEGKITDVNEASVQATGVPRGRLIGTDFCSYFTAPEQARAGYRQVFSEGFVRDYPLAIRHQDGHVTEVLYNASVYRDAQGQVLGVFAAARDVTERKRAEAALRQSREDLNRAQAVAQTGSWRLDVRRNELVWSDENYRIFGVAPGTPLTYETFLSRVHPEDRAYVDREWKAALAGQPYDIQHRILVENGPVKWVRERAELEQDEAGALRGGIGTTQDVTELRRAEESIRQLNADLERRVRERTAELSAANQELESFSYAVSHDLRAPLRAMCGFSQALVEDHGATLQGEARVYLEQIIRASRHMSELVDGLLTLSRCTRGELRREAVDLSALCERIRSELTRAEPERRVEWQIQPGLVACGDPRMIEVVMSNLLGNAWKYTGRQPAPVIRVYAGLGDGRQCFCVADNGAGFDMKHTEQLFKPFQRLHRQEEFPGTGIGLATVQRILHRHGGTIHATAAVGQGATFTFSLPEPDTPNPSSL